MIGQCDATFPRMIQLPLGNSQFRCLVIFVPSGHSPVYGYQSGLIFACLIYDLIHFDVFLGSSYPASVQPKKVYPTITRHEFIDLISRIFLKTFPFIRIQLDIIIHIPSGRCPVSTPVIIAMPVGLGEVSTYHKVFLTEGIKHLIGHIF